MKNSLKYVILIGIALLVITSLIWYAFLRENKEITYYKEKFEKQVANIKNNSSENVPSESDNNSSEPTKPEETTKPDDGNIVHVKPNDDTNVIISSDTEMLNKQGKELLEQISKELEDSIITISDTPGIVDTEILDENKEIKIEE